jgi:hypothetical protein
MGAWHGPGPHFGGLEVPYSANRNTGARRRQRAVKRIEAEERNERTKPERRRAHRRQHEADLARAAS